MNAIIINDQNIK